MKSRSSILLLILLWTLPFGLWAQESSPDEPNTTTLVLVRHTEKMADGSKDPSLTDEGEERAIKLASYLLERFNIRGIFSTPYKRTQLTAAPIADSLSLPVISYEWGDPDEFLKMVLNEYQGESVLIVGHSNTTPILVNKLLGEEKYEWLQEDEHDSIFILKANGEQILEDQKANY